MNLIKSDPQHLILVDLSDSVDDPKFEIYCETRINYLFRNQSYEAIIPKGFTTDFGSVPKKFRSIISNVSKFNVAWLLHDYMYSKFCSINISKSDADILLRRNLEYLGMSYVDRWIVYYSVKYFGKKRFRTD